MTHQLNMILAAEHISDLRRSADAYRATLTEPEDAAVAAIVLRLADEGDAASLRELAELDEAAVPAGPVLLALVGDEVISALSLTDGSVIANPFVRTEDAVTLLRLRAEHLSSARRSRRWRAIPRLRLA
jgi:hypothetical protein